MLRNRAVALALNLGDGQSVIHCRRESALASVLVRIERGAEREADQLALKLGLVPVEVIAGVGVFQCVGKGLELPLGVAVKLGAVILRNPERVCAGDRPPLILVVVAVVLGLEVAFLLAFRDVKRNLDGLGASVVLDLRADDLADVRSVRECGAAAVCLC